MANHPQIGDIAPDFEALTDSGETVKLSDFRGNKVILYFYPMDNTPGCTMQACGFRDDYHHVAEKGAVVLGVSPDSIDSHRRFKEKFNLPYPLLVDTDRTIAKAYGVSWGIGKLSMHVRSHFVIDEEGRIADAHVRVAPRTSVAKALEAL